MNYIITVVLSVLVSTNLFAETIQKNSDKVMANIMLVVFMLVIVLGALLLASVAGGNNMNSKQKHYSPGPPEPTDDNLDSTQQLVSENSSQVIELVPKQKYSYKFPSKEEYTKILKEQVAQNKKLQQIALVQKATIIELKKQRKKIENNIMETKEHMKDLKYEVKDLKYEIKDVKYELKDVKHILNKIIRNEHFDDKEQEIQSDISDKILKLENF